MLIAVRRYYGEETARTYYGEWSPPVGSLPPTDEQDSAYYALDQTSFALNTSDMSNPVCACFIVGFI